MFASVAMGMRIYSHGVDTIIHLGAPSSIEDYFQDSGRRGQSGDSAYSIVYWTPKDCQTGDFTVSGGTHSIQVHQLQALLDLLQYSKKLN